MLTVGFRRRFDSSRRELAPAACANPRPVYRVLSTPDLIETKALLEAMSQ